MTLTASPPELEERIGTSKLTQLSWLSVKGFEFTWDCTVLFFSEKILLLKSEETSFTFFNQDLHIYIYTHIKYMRMHGLAIILRRLSCWFDKMLKNPSIFRFKDLLGFLLYTLLVFEDL